MSDMRELRGLLESAFDSEDLIQFCFDYFLPVYEEFTTGMTKGQMVQLLIDYCYRQKLLPQLLTLVQKERPGLVIRSELRDFILSSPSFSKQSENQNFSHGKSKDVIINILG